MPSPLPIYSSIPPAKSGFHLHHSTDRAFIKFPLPSFQVQRTFLRPYPIFPMRLALTSFWNSLSPWLLRHHTILGSFWFLTPLFLIFLCSLLFPAGPLMLLLLGVDLGPSSHPIWSILSPHVLTHTHDFHHQSPGLPTPELGFGLGCVSIAHKLLLCPGLIRYLSFIHLAPQGRTSERQQNPLSPHTHFHPMSKACWLYP